MLPSCLMIKLTTGFMQLICATLRKKYKRHYARIISFLRFYMITPVRIVC